MLICYVLKFDQYLPPEYKRTTYLNKNGCKNAKERQTLTNCTDYENLIENEKFEMTDEQANLIAAGHGLT